MKRRIKSWLGAGTFGAGLHRMSLRQRAVIAVFHRIDDSLPGNPITCSRAEFEGYCSFFQRHFDVISMNALLDRLDGGIDVSRALVITFDDGYLDNHDVAAPVLRSHGLPACFFVATGFIESQRVPWWDEENGITPRWMTWDHVRDLAAQGFEIGPHTVNHADLSEVGVDEARREIAESRDTLERELGGTHDLFSYPYGREGQITEDVRGIVRELGFRCCASAFGGLVTPDSDPFHLRRTPISPWHRSPTQWGFELILERT